MTACNKKLSYRREAARCLVLLTILVTRSEDTAHLVCQLSTYNIFPVIRTTIAKTVIFTYPGLHFCLPWGRICGNHAKRWMNEKTIQCLPNPSQHVPIYLQQFPSYSNRSAKNLRFHVYRSPHFCFPWGRPWGNHAKCCMDGKRIRCLQIVSLPVHI